MRRNPSPFQQPRSVSRNRRRKPPASPQSPQPPIESALPHPSTAVETAPHAPTLPASAAPPPTLGHAPATAPPTPGHASAAELSKSAVASGPAAAEPSKPAPPAPPDRGAPPFIYENVYEDLAIFLAHTLDDMGSLPYYLKVADRFRRGEIMPRSSRSVVFQSLMHKAKELAALREPAGYIRCPGAVFAGWVKLL